MPRKPKKLSAAEQAAKEAEILSAPIDTSNQVVNALMSPEFEKMSNLDASQIALMLQELVRGQNSLLANAESNTFEIARLRERQDKADREIAERLEANQKFVEEVMDRAEGLKRTGAEHDKLIANGVAMYNEARSKAIANRAAKNIAFRQKMASEPKKMVISGGQLVTTIEHGQQVTKILPEEVRIADMRWVLPPGIPVEVPETVAGVLEQRRVSQIETSKRQGLLSKHMEATKLAEEWSKIEGSKTDQMPL